MVQDRIILERLAIQVYHDSQMAARAKMTPQHRRDAPPIAWTSLSSRKVYRDVARQLLEEE